MTTATIPTVTDRFELIEANYQPSATLNAEDGSWSIGKEHESRRGSWSVREHNKLDFGFALPQRVDAVALVEWMAEQQPLVDRITAGHSVAWDGNNHVGRLTDDASEALETLREAIVCGAIPELGEGEGTWEAGDWFDGTLPGDLGITAETADEEIASLAKQAVEEAKANQGAILDEADVVEYLTGRRDRLSEASNA